MSSQRLRANSVLLGVKNAGGAPELNFRTRFRLSGVRPKALYSADGNFSPNIRNMGPSTWIFDNTDRDVAYPDAVHPIALLHLQGQWGPEAVIDWTIWGQTQGKTSGRIDTS